MHWLGLYKIRRRRFWRDGDDGSDAGGERRCQAGRADGSADADVVTAVEENNLCVWETTAAINVKAGWRERTNEGGEVK